MGNYNSTVFATQEANEMMLVKKHGQVFQVHSAAKWKNHFEGNKETSKLMVIYFTATWCGPCRNFEPVVRDFAATYVNVDFIKIDADVLEGVAKEYGMQAMPTFILMKKGKVIDKVVEVKKDELQKKIEKYMA